MCSVVQTTDAEAICGPDTRGGAWDGRGWSATPALSRLVGVKLDGPARSLAASCAAAPACGQVDFSGKRPSHPDCSALEKIGLHHAITGGSGDVWIAPVTCAVPGGIHSDDREYHVFVRRGDAWWHGGVLEATTETHNNFDALQVTWDERDGGSRVVAEVEITHSSIECNRQRDRDEQTTYELVIDPRAAPPVVYPKLVVGARESMVYDNTSGTDPSCPAINPSTTKLTTHWLGSGRIELSGSADATDSGDGPRPGLYQLVAP